MISNKIMQKIHNLLMQRLSNGNSPVITFEAPFFESNNIFQFLSEDEFSKIFNSVDSTVSNKTKEIADYTVYTYGFTQIFDGVEYSIELLDTHLVQISITPASIMDILSGVAFNDIPFVKEYMKESLGAKEVHIKVIY